MVTSQPQKNKQPASDSVGLFDRVNKLDVQSAIPLSGLCPHCSHRGTFHHYHGDILSSPANVIYGFRYCPNPSCKMPFLVIYTYPSNILKTFPATTIAFDEVHVPEKIIGAFREALVCHANDCQIASAIMIRKTIELICVDRGATGENLSKKIKSLKTVVTLPPELLEGVDILRMLGNDAAHINNQVFESINVEEIEVAIEFTKDLIKALYQHKELLSRLQALRTKSTPESPR